MKKTQKNFYNIPVQLFLIGLLTLGLYNCTSKQQVIKEAKPASTLITYSKVRGRGMTKPLYTIEVLDSKEVKYTGIANVPEIGEQISSIKAKEYAAILDQFQSADFQSFEESYKTRMRDLPLSRIAFEGHTVTYQEAACPSELRVLTDLIEGLIGE